jgi:salicylate hydroxylase
MPPLRRWGEGPMTLVGDAAHPMLPFLAQGAAMAIEDAAVLADRLAQSPGDVPAALRAYEADRRPRTAGVQRAARRNGKIYHRAGVEAVLRNLAMRGMGGERLIGRYGWIYNWRAPQRSVEPQPDFSAWDAEPRPARSAPISQEHAGAPLAEPHAKSN